MKKLKDMANIHKGRAALVLGGGPSLMGDVARVMGGFDTPLRGTQPAVKIAVNHHASCAGMDPDYMVFWDDPIHFPLLFFSAKDFGGVKVSPLMEYTDVDVRGVDYWNGPCTDKVATWLACYFGCDPVILCGMDLYQGEVKYCHPGEPEYKPIYDMQLSEHLKRWRIGFQRCPGIERVRAASGPLVEMFGGIG